MSDGLRFIFAGDSIVSDWGNPGATTSRAVVTALLDLGHEVTYLEPRRNPATVELLQARGAAPLRAFLDANPKLQYRTIDLPASYEVIPWAGQFLATASAAIALIDCPEIVRQGFDEFQDPEMRLFHEVSMGPGRTELRQADAPESAIPFRPAVLPRRWEAGRAGMALVAYDDAELARSVSDLVPDARRIVSGSAELPGWEFVPEVELPPIYGSVERALIVDGAGGSLAPARVWLARANGARAWGVVDRLEPDLRNVAVEASRASRIDWNEATPLPDELDARRTAELLVRQVAGQIGRPGDAVEG